MNFWKFFQIMKIYKSPELPRLSKLPELRAEFIITFQKILFICTYCRNLFRLENPILKFLKDSKLHKFSKIAE